MQSMRRTIWVLASNTLIALALWVTTDLIVSNSSLRFQLIPDSFRIPDVRIHHTLEKNVSAGLTIWGAAHYAFSTNALGFRDSTVRVVKVAPEKSVRVLFLGDSFTEGVGLPWEKTFVGIFQSQYPGVEVLNAGVIGYSPSIYLRQMERFLCSGFLTTHVIIYIDISDVQDEALYKFDEVGNVVDSGFVVNPRARVSDPPETIQYYRAPGPTYVPHWWNSLLSNFRVTRYLVHEVFDFSKDNRGNGSDRLVKSMWTVMGSKLQYGYGDLGVGGGIEKELHNMDQLADILRKKGVGFSVAVYPWPDQLEYDMAESREVGIWRSWCKTNGCERFINHFPDCFALKSQGNWRDLVYIHGDVHFNTRGNEIIATRLASEMASVLAQRR
jgi:hypothetical protein